MNDKIMDLELKKADAKTSNIFHLFMTIMTGGVWLIIWAYCAFSNKNKRDYYDKMILKEKKKLIKGI